MDSTQVISTKLPLELSPAEKRHALSVLGTRPRVRVYQALRRLCGRFSIRFLANEAEVTNTGFYMALEYLVAQGLVSDEKRDGVRRLRVLRDLEGCQATPARAAPTYFVFRSAAGAADSGLVCEGLGSWVAQTVYRAICAAEHGATLRLKDLGSYRQVRNALQFLEKEKLILMAHDGPVSGIVALPCLPEETSDEEWRTTLLAASSDLRAGITQKYDLLNQVEKLKEVYYTVYRARHKDTEPPESKPKLGAPMLELLQRQPFETVAGQLAYFLVSPRDFDALDGVIERFGATFLTFYKNHAAVVRQCESFEASWNRGKRRKAWYMWHLERVGIYSDIIASATSAKGWDSDPPPGAPAQLTSWPSATFIGGESTSEDSNHHHRQAA